MKDPLSSLFNAKILKVSLALLVVLFLYSIPGRVPDIDDAWVGELAYWLAEDGHMHSNLMRGITLQEEKFVVNNKLFTLMGALFIKVFGFSLYTIKSVSLAWFVLFLLIFSWYTLKRAHLFRPADLLFALMLLFAYPWIFKYSFLFRPEIMMMTLGFAGFVLLEKYLDAGGKDKLSLLLAAFLFGLTMATHLNGIILIAAAFILLIWDRHLKDVPLFGIFTLLGLSPYFYDMTQASDYALWHHQFFDSPSLDSLEKTSAWLKPFFNLLNEHMRYFHNPKIIVFSIFMFATIIIGFTFLHRRHKNLTRFALLIFLLTGIFAMHKSRQYILLNLPYLVIMMTLTFRALNEGEIKAFRLNNPGLVRLSLVALLFVFLGTSVFYNLLLSIEKFSSSGNASLTEKYFGDHPGGKRIVAPMTFIFNEIEKYESIQADLCFVELQKSDPGIYGSGFLLEAAEFGAELIMVEPYYQSFLGIDEMKPGDTLAGFMLLDDTEFAKVFKRAD